MRLAGNSQMTFPIADPERCLLLAIIHQALDDWRQLTQKGRMRGLGQWQVERIDIDYELRRLGQYFNTNFEADCEMADLDIQYLRQIWSIDDDEKIGSG